MIDLTINQGISDLGSQMLKGLGEAAFANPGVPVPIPDELVREISIVACADVAEEITAIRRREILS